MNQLQVSRAKARHYVPRAGYARAANVRGTNVRGADFVVL